MDDEPYKSRAFRRAGRSLFFPRARLFLVILSPLRLHWTALTLLSGHLPVSSLDICHCSYLCSTLSMRLLSILSCTLSLSLTVLPFVTFASSNIGDRDIGNSNGVQSRTEHQRVAICRRDPTSLEEHALAKRDTVDGSGNADVTVRGALFFSFFG